MPVVIKFYDLTTLTCVSYNDVAGQNIFSKFCLFLLWRGGGAMTAASCSEIMTRLGFCDEVSMGTASYELSQVRVLF